VCFFNCKQKHVVESSGRDIYISQLYYIDVALRLNDKSKQEGQKIYPVT
jgi:hypothetical protein